MNFDQAFAIFISWQTALLCLAIYMTTFTIRKFVESSWQPIKTKKLWTEFFLPVAPIANGVILALVMTSFPWPDLVAQDVWSRSFYAAVCGLSSGWLFGRFRSVMKAKDTTDKTMDDMTDPTEPKP